MELEEILARVERRLTAVGLSASAASKAAGKPDAIRNLQRAVEKGDRQGVSTATLNALAPVLRTTSVWLFAGAGPEEPGSKAESAKPENQGVGSSAPSPADLVPARYAGTVEAGAFRPTEDFEPDPDRGPLWERRDRDFPEAELFYVDVNGDSMNALKPRPIMPGDQVVVIDFESLRGRVALRDGMVVIVEQTLDGGHHRERSVKQIELYEDRIEFCPRSTNPKHKPIVVPRTVFFDPSEDDGRQVRILSLVRRISNEVPLS